MRKDDTMKSSKNGAHSEANFEASFKKLQEVVRLLSEGNLSLQESLAAFEEGMSLAERCSSLLEQAELRVKQVSEKASRAGASSLAGPLEIVRGGLGAGDVVEFEFEETVIIEAEAAPLSRDDVFEDTPQDKPPRGASRKPSRKAFDSIFDELDPLFDDND